MPVCFRQLFSPHYKVRKALLAKGYILDIIGGGITGDVQCNETHVHHFFKKKYQDFVAELMNEMLLQYPY